MSDSAQKNVINLGSYGHKRREAGNGQAARALAEIRDLASKKLKQNLERMMEKIDDTLFARAEKAESNMIQTLYFDAMRELRIIRKDIEEDFITHLTTQFDQGIPRQTQNSGNFNLGWEDENPGLGLVEKNDMEEDLAVSNMVHKIRGNCTQSLFALDKRIGFLLRDPDLERWQNPLGPEAVCAAFRQAADRIETGLEIRLVVFKLFDQHVAGYLDMLYKEVNQHLVKRGVLPEIKATIRRSVNPLTGTTTPVLPPSAETGLSATASDAPGYTPTQSPANGVVGGGIPAGGGYYVPGQPAIHALTFLQQGSIPSPEPGTDGTPLQIDPADLTSGQVNVLHGIKNSPLARDMGKAGDMTIGMVAMLFDYILDDKNIPDAMRALIGRLQIPVLKAALLDCDFFSRKSHPARQLLNRLAATAVGWDEELGTQDPVYLKVGSIVQTILDEFEEDTSLFGTLLDELDGFLSKDEEQAEVRAQRSAKVMEGQERLEVAKATTMEEIEPRINDQRNLDFVRSFVTTHWKNLLFITCARQGKESETWKQAVATMDDLIWSVKPKYSLEERRRLVSMQPALLQKLREGMQRLSIPATERDDFIARLVHAHGRTAVNKGDADEEAAVQQDVTTPTSSVIEREPGTTVASHSIASQAKRDSTKPAPEVNDRFTARIRQLKTGDWVEFRSSNGKAKRAKLSWVSPITNTYLFTDRQGLKSGNYGIEELARLMRGARACILNAAPLMDRAVSTVLKEYQKH